MNATMKAKATKPSANAMGMPDSIAPRVAPA